MRNKEKLNKLLFSLLGDVRLVDKWWNSPNLAFNGKTPIEVYQDDSTKQDVEDYILSYIDKN